MHPAYSVILFTTASGAGLGLLAWLALLGLLGAVPAERWLGLAGLAGAFLLVTGGLAASTTHLGRPSGPGARSRSGAPPGCRARA